MEIDQLDLEAARQRVGDDFELRSGDGVAPLALVLTEAEPLSAANPGGFTMLFRGPTEPLLAQSIYELHDDRWGVTELFLVPVAQDGDGTYYEAIVNRPT